MFAVIKTGGKQYKVAKDDVIAVERLTGEAGDKVEFKEVLMVGGAKEDGSDAVVGAPLVDGASVSAEVVDQTRGPKIVVFKKKRRHNYRRKKGHRQDLTQIKILDIKAKGSKAAPKKAAAKKAAPKKAAPEKAEAKPDAEEQ